MGAKQSKRSVDISGKEAEGASEVAAAGAVVEGRVEQLVDADALKPQLNGELHIENTEKDKQLDSGTPENEKDATTEKEGKEENESNKEKEATPVTNGDTETKAENGESTPTSEDAKKPKKEKVKKKWSLRSISFSRKDKPKQEKKQKEEEPKTNGEPEKVPEEAAEATADAPTNDVTEAKTEEIKDEKTPDTPVTEPLTNGSSTPESPKVETPPAEEPAPVPVPVAAAEPEPVAEADTAVTNPESERQETKVETQPEQLPVNGLSLEEPKSDAPEVALSEESKPEEQPTAETTESVPAPEIPVKKEVCVEQMPLDSTPPPLPAYPPPSSVVSFAATTMAPELTVASIPNTAELPISAQHSPDTKANNINEIVNVSPAELNNILNNVETIPTTDVTTELPPPLKEIMDEPAMTLKSEVNSEVITQKAMEVVEVAELPITVASVPESNVDTYETVTEHIETIHATGDQLDNSLVVETADQRSEIKDKITEIESPVEKVSDIPKAVEMLDVIDDLPPPPPMIIDNVVVHKNIENENIDVTVRDNIIGVDNKTEQIISNLNHMSEKTDVNGLNAESPNGNEGPQHENLKYKTKDSLEKVAELVECNGNVEETNIINQETTENNLAANNLIEERGTAATPDDSAPPSLSEANESLPTADGASNEASEAFPPPPSELCRSESEPSPPPPGSPDLPAPCDSADKLQEPLPVSDKLADLIPEVPVVPEIKTETLQETTSDVAVAN